MNRVALLVVGVFLTFACVGCPRSGISGSRATVVFHNFSDAEITELFIRTAEFAPGWGPNLVLGDPLLPSETRTYDNLDCSGWIIISFTGPGVHESFNFYLDPGEIWEYWFYG